MSNLHSIHFFFTPRLPTIFLGRSADSPLTQDFAILPFRLVVLSLIMLLMHLRMLVIVPKYHCSVSACLPPLLFVAVILILVA